MGLLEKRIWVDATPDTVSIGIHFPDPDLAFDLVEAALQNFLEARRTAEISSIEEAITILEGRSAEAHDAVETALADMAKARGDRAARLGLRSRVPVSAPLDKPVDKAGAQLITEVQTRRQQIAALEEVRARRMMELQTQLEEQRAVYSDSHPVVTRLEQDVEALRREPPEMQALRKGLGNLERELRQRGLLADVPLGAKRIRSLSGAAALEPIDPREDEDADVTYTKAAGPARARPLQRPPGPHRCRPAGAGQRPGGIQAPLRADPSPQRPKGPVKPKVALVLLASTVAGAVLGLFAPSLVDLLSRGWSSPGRSSRCWEFPSSARSRSAEVECAGRRRPSERSVLVPHLGGPSALKKGKTEPEVDVGEGGTRSPGASGRSTTCWPRETG